MLLKDAALVLGLTFDPLVIVSDFELAMVQASTLSFPNSYHRGCYYFNQHQPRTNNNVEGWHSRIKKIISKPHPNIFAWIEFIQREESVTKAKIHFVKEDVVLKKRRKRYRPFLVALMVET